MRLHFRQGTTQGNFQCVCYHWLINPYLSCYLATRLILLRRNKHIGAQRPLVHKARKHPEGYQNLPPTATTPIPPASGQAGIRRPLVVARAWAMHRTVAICSKSEPIKPGSIIAMLPWLLILLPSGHHPRMSATNNLSIFAPAPCTPSLAHPVLQESMPQTIALTRKHLTVTVTSLPSQHSPTIAGGQHRRRHRLRWHTWQCETVYQFANLKRENAMLHALDASKCVLKCVSRNVCPEMRVLKCVS